MRLLILLMTAFLLAQSAQGHEEHPKETAQMGLEEKLGQYVPLDLTFRDEEGRVVSLRQLIQGPTILALVYFRCPNVCSLVLQNLADTLNKLPADPGKEYSALAVSFDEREKPVLALERKRIYLQAFDRPFPVDAWRFLTGDKENIRKLTDAVGFHFKRVKEDFEHPVVLIILAADGKIVRYMYGPDPLPFDLRLAIVEASQGRIGPAISKIARFCFSYDPKGKKLVFNTLKVTGSVTLLFAFAFVVFLFFYGRRKRPREESER